MARAAGLTQDDVSRLERGRGNDVRKLRRHAAALDADVVVSIRWRGGEIDRLIDEGHAAIVGWAVSMLTEIGWSVEPEVTYAVFRERGSIDVLAWHAPTRTLLVVEVKTELTSVEETLRRHDEKLRLAPRIAAERFGWNPATVCRMLVLPDTTTARRSVARHDAVLGVSYRERAGAARAWLLAPDRATSLLVFAPFTRDTRGMDGRLSRKRIRRRSVSVRAGDANAALAPSTRTERT